MVRQENEVFSRKRANNRKDDKQVSLITIWKRPEQNSDSRGGITFLTCRSQYLGVNCQSQVEILVRGILNNNEKQNYPTEQNLYAGQEATVRTGHGTTNWFQIGKGVRQGYIIVTQLI